MGMVGIVGIVDIDGHGWRVCWPGPVSVENLRVGVSMLQFSKGFAIGLFTMVLIDVWQTWQGWI